MCDDKLHNIITLWLYKKLLYLDTGLYVYCCKAASSDLFYRLEFRPHVTPTAKRSGMPRPGHVEHKFICIEYTVLSYSLCVTPKALAYSSWSCKAQILFCHLLHVFTLAYTWRCCEHSYVDGLWMIVDRFVFRCSC